MPDWFTPLLLTLDALAVFRLSWLITVDDQPFGALRDRQAERNPDSLFTTWLTCPWCVSMWVAPPVMGLHVLLPGVWPYAAAVLAFSAVTGLLSEWAQR